MSLESLWAGWRAHYIDGAQQLDDSPRECVLCSIVASSDHDEELMVVYRGVSALVVLNIYPYTSGHVMVVPYLHTARLSDVEPSVQLECFDLVQRATWALESTYQPQGFNIGLNLGRAGGAGIEEHLHIHVVPRWVGDTNFMTTTANARVLPESLAETRRRIVSSWTEPSVFDQSR